MEAVTERRMRGIHQLRAVRDDPCHPLSLSCRTSGARLATDSYNHRPQRAQGAPSFRLPSDCTRAKFSAPPDTNSVTSTTHSADDSILTPLQDNKPFCCIRPDVYNIFSLEFLTLWFLNSIYLFVRLRNIILVTLLTQTPDCTLCFVYCQVLAL